VFLGGRLAGGCFVLPVTHCWGRAVVIRGLWRKQIIWKQVRVYEYQYISGFWVRASVYTLSRHLAAHIEPGPTPVRPRLAPRTRTRPHPFVCGRARARR
jgi:hypothetical protein